MYLKSLTALGFKSFADKTTLNFVPGVAAIVGPNGCGKSNISDAIRWVLGEQSAKALRGGEMADVIFNGTDHRKALGMAEVSITIGDVDGEHLKAAGIDVDFNEVTVTRRVFRDGGSDYYINKTACRLKDIQQLFMGTGMGRASYSIMAQGNITQIISSKPDDRRMVFEEAAGITRFKAQKKESLRKLEHTDQNLLRVQDLIKEVKRQIGSLQRQAGKARRYKQIQQELQHLDTQLARHQFDVLQGEVKSRQEAADKLRVENEICSESVLRLENEVLQLRARLSELEELIHLTQSESLELKGQIDRHENRVQFNEVRLREIDAQHGGAVQEITQAEERRSLAQSELDGVRERFAAATSALEQHRAALNERHEALRQVERELSNRQDALRKAQAESFAAIQQLNRVRNETNALEMQKQGNLARLEKLSSEKVQLEEERTRLEARLQEFAANVESEKATVLASRGTVEERQKRLREIQQEMNQATQALDSVLRQQAEKRSRLQVLEQLQGDYEGFSAAAQAVLKGAKEVVGSLTDKIRVPDQFVGPVELALGQNLQLVLTEQPEAARHILADLTNGKKGRASLAALGLLTNGSTGFDPIETLPQGTSRLLDMVETEDSVRPLINKLLGRTILAPDLDTGTNAWRELHGHCEVVTAAGETLNRFGIFTGGSGNGNGKPASSILLRKNQITELQTLLTQLQEQVAEASRVKGALQSEQTTLQASLQQAQSELRTQEVAIATRQGEFNALQSSLRSLHQKIDTVVYEIQRMASHEQEGEKKRAVLAAQITDLEAREAVQQQQLADHNTALEGLRVQRDTATSGLNEVKVTLAADEQSANGMRQQQRGLEQRVAEATALAERRRSELGSFAARQEQSKLEIEDSRAKIQTLSHERDTINGQLANFDSDKNAQQKEILSREEDLRGQRRRLESIQQNRGMLDVELAQKRMAIDNLRQRLQEKYQVNLDDIRSECITITMADEGPATSETLTPEEMAKRGLSTDWDAVSAQVAALQKRIDEIGPVNLVAIEEYEETEQRHTFLNTQYDDLVKAKEQLMEVINKINTQTRDMFLETFNKIRDNFRQLFVEIFGGGKADLILVNEGDVLESGIDIVARPPGKQLQSISLLSGGEQTMTAVALLFSIYQVKPSPFCLLDELDAPLDESNINRFVRVLQRFLHHSQFIVITHNKRTIGMADVLYGVTMEEHGVSKIVSVKFHKKDEAAPAQAVESKPLVPPAQMPSLAEETDKPVEKGEALEVAMAE